ncbi:MAG: endolytic transglycosylase MltG [Gemmatimonadetes bacterium]|nr:endolytic transglycosylase MltG [Gemmatimonadota bacterium]MYE15031.1 endolytic transglycosylase MltG [Gemmatimonadota bacterium]MYG23892.1 endolytic transglycosylase MltG [Gemmatimonadota bacterium]MYJ39776.1 endolytic transglycosylase MltG [Gemmatimonadota bacterium]
MREQPRSSYRTGLMRVRRTRPRIPNGDTRHRRTRSTAALAGIGALVGTLACAPPLPPGEAVVRIPEGATFDVVLDSLESRQIINRRLFVHAYARMRGLDRSVKAGSYRIERGAPTRRILDILTAGRVITIPMTIPEGFTIVAMAPRIAAATGSDSNAVANRLVDGSRHLDWDVPGPGLEGYLFPDTYRFAEGIGIETVVATMLEAYRAYWTPERRDRLRAIGLSENELVTLASIIQAEAVYTDEMTTISSVYHNRLRTGMRLQADPTVLYALGGHRPRLLYAAIDSVADNPYNTYAHAGLPPGPIGAPGAAALDAALNPADTDYLYFVARPNGEHIFTRSLREHNNARAQVRREASSAR